MNIILLAGFSRSGKSQAAKFYETIGYKHHKISNIEKRIMLKLDIDPDSFSIDPFEKLYEYEHTYVYGLFLDELKKEAESLKVDQFVLDSTTRVDMVEFFKKRKDVNFLSLYFEASFETRALREQLETQEVDLANAQNSTYESDNLKRERKVHLVKAVSTVIDNNGTVETFEKELKKKSDLL